MYRRLVLYSVLLFLTAHSVCPFCRADDLIDGFETDAWQDSGWESVGDAFGIGPVEGTLPNQMHVSGFEGRRLVNSYHNKDVSVGTLTSREFTLTDDFLSFLIGGGNHPEGIGAELLIGGRRQRVTSGTDSESLSWVSWNVSEFRGQTARIRLFDQVTGGWGHLLFDELTLTSASRETVPVGRLSDYRKSPHYYRERFRPQFHFTPEINWMNDPNGLVYLDGEYHLFYQHNPYGNEWGHMSWGHAVSRDLLHWKHLPIALHDEYDLMAFSGSAVVDHRNSSGFGRGDVPPLVAIYTGHGHGRQTQDIAFSNDQGRTWMKFSGNPVLDLNKADFRDPKVFWYEPSERWVMVVALAAEKILQFYGSEDLKQWTLLSEFGPAGVAHKPNWECPDLFELPIVNEPGKSRWVLEADMGSGAPAGGSGGEYFTGVFDGTTFVPDSTTSQWVDYGRDFYAPVSWSDVPSADGRRIWLGWMNNWETCLNPTSPWRSAMSVPRELTLRRIDGRLRLCQTPVRELETLHTAQTPLPATTLNDESVILSPAGQQLDITVEFETGTAPRFGLRVLKNDRQHTEIGYDVAASELSIDRTESGIVDFHPAFAGRHAGPLKPDAQGRIQLRILIDACSVEVFGNDGETVLTDLVFPDSSADQVEVFCSGGTARLIGGRIGVVRSVWQR